MKPKERLQFILAISAGIIMVGFWVLTDFAPHLFDGVPVLEQASDMLRVLRRHGD